MVIRERAARLERRPLRSRIRRPHPARVVLVGYLVATVAGSLLLMLPIARRGPGGAAPIEAIFTAVSAVSVTGHLVVDTPTYWTGFGHVVILVLLQLGGLGIMSFATILGLVVVRKTSLSSRLSAVAESRSLGIGDVGGIVRAAVVISLGIEAATSLLLALWWGIAYGMEPGRAIWYGLFHGISAFNNAGFSLFDDSMARYVADPVVNLIIAAAVILGGLGFPVLVELRREIRTPRLWSMNTRIVVAATPVLLVLGTVCIAALEWDNPRTLGALHPATRIMTAFFTSAQTRAGGFNTIDIGQMHETSWVAMDVLMFIGAGPAGTGGGIKVTTFAVLLFILLAEIRGDGAVNVFGKRLSRAVHRQAISVALVSVGVVVAATGVVMQLAGSRLGETVFEVISAFATVGLSTGLTAQLPVAAQLILAVLMFVGRLGPITFATAIALRSRSIPYQLPKERPIIG